MAPQLDQIKKSNACIVVSGNMGIGKTTLCTGLAKQLNAEIASELSHDNEILRAAYNDRAKNNFLLQVYFLFSRFQKATTATQSNLIIHDRFFYDGPEVFAPVHQKLGNLTPHEFQTLLMGYASILPFVQPPDLLVYLPLDPEIALQRIRQRGEAYENKVSPQYVNELHYQYEEFFKNYSRGRKIRIDAANYDFRDQNDVREISKLITKEIPA